MFRFSRVILGVGVLALLLGWRLAGAEAAASASAKSKAGDRSSAVSGERVNAISLAASGTLTYTFFFPLVGRQLGAACPIAAGGYGTVAVLSAPTNPPAAINADLNLALRGYITTTGTLGLIDLASTPDPRAPQLYRLFVDN
ncbi:MAG: hypothetical protein KGJ80_21980, partial [Chloroflexota bacterium]|nr:hypothetical protein [Chloroflexota bacterium]